MMSSTDTAFGLQARLQKKIYQPEIWHAICPDMVLGTIYIPVFENFGNFGFLQKYTPISVFIFVW